MNKKYLVYSILMILLVTNKSLFSMHQLIFRGSKIIGVGTLPVLGGALAYKRHKEIKNFQHNLSILGNVGESLQEQDRQICYTEGADKLMPANVEIWLRDKMEQLGVPAFQTMPIEVGRTNMTWAIILDGALLGDKPQVEELNRALLGEIDNADEIKGENAMWVGHEMKHYINEDSKKKIQSFFLTPLAVEGACSTVTHNFNKLCGLEAPKTFLKTAVRSSIAVGSIIPKLGLNVLGVMLYQRHQEKDADKFACKNAKTRIELEGFRNRFKKEADCFEGRFQFPKETSEFRRKNILRLEAAKFDRIHPYVRDREEMVQGYIDEWDKKHADDCSDKTIELS